MANLEWKLIAAGIWELPGTKVTVHFRPGRSVPYSVFWGDSELAWCGYKDEAFKRAEEFICELTEAGMDA